MSKFYGSLENRLLEQTESPVPFVGMGVTKILYTDRHPYQVVEVISDKEVVVRRCRATLIEGKRQSEHQVYEYTLEEKKPFNEKILRKYKQGWRVKKTPQNSVYYYLGSMEEYYDPCF